MGHKADADFFKEKRSWSIQKDRILSSYLTAYLPKIRTQRRRVLLVDGFAGAGKFGDGSPGSPLLILDTIRRAGMSGNSTLLAIEDNPDLFGELSGLLKEQLEVVTRQGKFLDHVAEIRERATTHSVFLYLDPCVVRGLEIEKLDPLISLLREGRSVEVLINFNAPIFTRWALAAMARPVPVEYTDEMPMSPEISELHRIVGGGWWQGILQGTAEFPEQVDGVVSGYCNQLRARFREVCFHRVFEKTVHQIPKYVLVFGSRHAQALELMNDEMIRATRRLIEAEAAGQAGLFDGLMVVEEAERLQLRSDIETAASVRRPRRHLIQEVIRRRFGVYLTKEIRGEIESLLKEGVMVSETGRTTTNHKTKVWWRGPTS